MVKIIKDNDASMLVSKESTTPTQFWAMRREVDARLKTLVQNLQAYIFRNFSAFLLPSHSLAPRGKEVRDIGISPDEAIYSAQPIWSTKSSPMAALSI